MCLCSDCCSSHRGRRRRRLSRRGRRLSRGDGRGCGSGVGRQEVAEGIIVERLSLQGSVRLWCWQRVYVQADVRDVTTCRVRATCTSTADKTRPSRTEMHARVKGRRIPAVVDGAFAAPADANRSCAAEASAIAAKGSSSCNAEANGSSGGCAGAGALAGAMTAAADDASAAASSPKGSKKSSTAAAASPGDVRPGERGAAATAGGRICDRRSCSWCIISSCSRSCSSSE